MRRTQYIENLWRDLHYALRMLAKSPGFTVIIVLTLALSIGANSAIFSVIDGVLLRPLPYPEADRIVRVFFHSATYPKFPLNPFDFRDFRERNRSFDSLAGFTRGDLQLSGAGRPERFTGFMVTAGYFRVLGLHLARGHEFNTKDELPGNGRLVILSDRLWRSRFAADPNILGRKIMLDAQPFTVTGVMPPGTEHPGNEYHGVPHGDSVDVWWPFTFRGDPAQRGSHFLEGIGRLKSGVSPSASPGGSRRNDRATRARASRHDGRMAGPRDSALSGNCGSYTTPVAGIAGCGCAGAVDRLRERGEPAVG